MIWGGPRAENSRWVFFFLANWQLSFFFPGQPAVEFFFFLANRQLSFFFPRQLAGEFFFPTWGGDDFLRGLLKIISYLYLNSMWKACMSMFRASQPSIKSMMNFFFLPGCWVEFFFSSGLLSWAFFFFQVVELSFFFFRVVELSFFFPGRVAVEFFIYRFCPSPPPNH